MIIFWILLSRSRSPQKLNHSQKTLDKYFYFSIIIQWFYGWAFDWLCKWERSKIGNTRVPQGFLERTKHTTGWTLTTLISCLGLDLEWGAACPPSLLGFPLGSGLEATGTTTGGRVSLVWEPKCRFMSLRTRNGFWQISHLWGFSPVWILRWFCR